MGLGTERSRALGGTPLSEAAGIRIAAFAAAVPFVCCAAGLVVLTILRHRQADLAGRYAALGMVPWRAAVDRTVELPSYLYSAGPVRDIIARNPAQWSTDIGMASFALTPALLIAGAVLVYGLASRRMAAISAALIPIVFLAWYSYAPLAMIASGREFIMDAARDTFSLNGRRLARMSDIAGFSGRTYRSAKGEVDWGLIVSLRSGREISLEGPDARADTVAAAGLFNAALDRLGAARR